MTDEGKKTYIDFKHDQIVFFSNRYVLNTLSDTQLKTFSFENIASMADLMKIFFLC